MRIKTFKTERGAEKFARRVRALHPQNLYKIASCIDAGTFRTEFYVLALIHDVWYPVGPLTKKAK